MRRDVQLIGIERDVALVLTMLVDQLLEQLKNLLPARRKRRRLVVARKLAYVLNIANHSHDYVVHHITTEGGCFCHIVEKKQHVTQSVKIFWRTGGYNAFVNMSAIFERYTAQGRFIIEVCDFRLE